MKKFVVLLMCIILASTPILAAEVSSEPDNKIFGFFQDAVNFVSEKATEAGEAIQGAFNMAGDTIGKWFEPKQQGSNQQASVQQASDQQASDQQVSVQQASDAGTFFNNLGEGITNFAIDASETIVSISQNFAEQAATAFNNFSNFVVDGYNNMFANPAPQNSGSENPKTATTNEMQNIANN